MKAALSLALFVSLVSAYALRYTGPAGAPSGINQFSSSTKEDPGPTPEKTPHPPKPSESAHPPKPSSTAHPPKPSESPTPHRPQSPSPTPVGSVLSTDGSSAPTTDGGFDGSAPSTSGT